MESPAQTCSKAVADNTVMECADPESGNEHLGAPQAFNGWMYKSVRLGPLRIPYFASPQIQLLLVTLVAVLCSDMMNTLTGLGGGGQGDAHDANNAQVAYNCTSAGLGFFVGGIINRLGIKTSLFLGCIGFPIYISSFLSYNHNYNPGYLIFAGGLAGFCGSMLWVTQGVIMTSYPPESSKGRFVSWFYLLYSSGGVIASLVPLSLNLDSTTNKVTDGTYIALMALAFSGAILALFVLESKKVRRQDGSRVIRMKNPSWKSEIFGLYQTLRDETHIILLFPMFFTSAWYSPYQINDVNLAKFNIRTRSLNNTLGGLFTIPGALLFGYGLDQIRFRRRVRAKTCHVVLLILVMAVWGGSYAWQRGYTRSEVSDSSAKEDFTSPNYIAPMFLYISYGFFDAAWTTVIYWYIGALTNNSRRAANFLGFFRGLQSTGAAIAFRLDALDIPYMTNEVSCWALTTGSLILAAPVVWWKIQDSVLLEKDLEFSDTTLADVLALPVEVERVRPNGPGLSKSLCSSASKTVALKAPEPTFSPGK